MSSEAEAMKPDDKRTLTPKMRFQEFKNDADWIETTLGSIAAFYKGRGVSKADIDPAGKRPCIRYGELYTRYDEIIDHIYSTTSLTDSELFLSCKNDVIIPASGETKEDIAKASCVMLDDVALGSDMNVIRTAHNGVFLSYYLNSAKRHDIAKIAQGDTVVHLYASQLESLSISIPKSGEQQKIAGSQTSLRALIAVHQRKLGALHALKKALLQQLFPREGDTIPRLRFPAFQDAREWQKKTLADVATIRAGTTPLRSESKFYKGGTIPWVKTTDLTNSFISNTEECITPEANSRINPRDSVLVAMYGGFNQIGRTGYLKMPAATNQAISVLNPNQDELTPIYLLMWLNAKIQYWKRVASSSRKDPNITSADVERFPIVFPRADEQRKIADCLSSIEELISAQNKWIDMLKTHKAGLMQQLFPPPQEAL
ncbi:MAG TPA: restriction endonuclease subunit S [Candidatus Angelobacter sp.]|jgi:type I restriction enzyme S subunit